MKNYWLVKSEPSVYSLADLRRDGQTHWDGVRNYQARNFMRDQMRIGDRVLFYHSNTVPPAIVGVAEVSRAGYPDMCACDPNDPHYDPKATPENPIWSRVDIKYRAEFPVPVTLDALRADPELEGLPLTRRGSRLSVMPISEAHFQHICVLGAKK